MSLDEVIVKRNQGVNTTTEKVEYSETGVKVIRANNISTGIVDYSNCVYVAEKTFERIKDACKPQKGDILYTNIGSQLGNAALVNTDENFVIAWNVLRLQPSNKINADFLVYLLNNPSNKKMIQSLNSSSTMPFVSGGEIGKVEFSFPDLNKQAEIAKILKSLDDKIHLNNQINQTLESIAQAIFKSWFIDFDPVRAKIAAKLEGKNPELAAMCAISGKSEVELEQMSEDDFAELQATAALFPDELVESELGEVPKGWVVEKLSQNIDVLNGYAFKSKAYIKEGIFVLRTKNFNNGLVEGLADDVYLPKIFLEEYPNYICEPYDYHMVMVGASIGDTGLIFPSMLPALRNQNMWCFRAKNSSDFGKSYTKLLLDSLIYETLGFASGSAREFFRKGDFQDKRVCVPSKKLLRRFEKIGFSCMQKQSIIFAENYYLKKIRDTLLPKLLSGEIDVSSIQETIDD